MNKNNNIFVKIQIEKDKNSGDLALSVRFDKDTPNFFKDKDAVSWCPTLEEINFVNEAFEMVSNRKNRKHEEMENENKKMLPYVEKKAKNHSQTSKEEKSSDAQPKKGEKDTKGTLSDSEKKDIDEWLV